MRLRATTAVTAILMVLGPAASRANLSAYSQNFESLVISNPAALQGDGWIVYGNVFSPDRSTFYYGYGPFPAPNPGGGFCAIDAGQGGTEQGQQQLSVYSDYASAEHANGNLVESNVYREQTIAAADVGGHWVFQFDAKRGNLVSPTTALAFIKTLDPNNGYATTNFRKVNMTAVPSTWGTYSTTIAIDASLVGQILQIGFATTATHYDGSGIFYDNLSWSRSTAGVGDTPRGGSLALQSARPNPFRNATSIEYSLGERGPAEVGVYDIVGRRVATLFKGIAEPGPHVARWDGRTADGRLAPAGVYRCVLKTAAGRQARSIVLDR